ncbi:MAG: hypothetical protein GHCLOJNM_01574 [bacterium]|nr:hypothetical protein [bacterium]
MNLYTQLSNVNSRLGLVGSSADDAVIRAIQAASRMIDDAAQRNFFVTSATRYFDSWGAASLIVPDLLVATEVACDYDGDGVYETVLVQGTDCHLLPHNSYPKWLMISAGEKALPNGLRSVRVAGTWGYAETADPFVATSVTATVATTNGTTLTATPGTSVVRGDTIRVGDEQMYVTAVAASTVTVRRAVNGTTASTHSGATVYVVRAPESIEHLCELVAARCYSAEDGRETTSERIGNYSVSYATGGASQTTGLTTAELGALSKYVVHEVR